MFKEAIAKLVRPIKSPFWRHFSLRLLACPFGHGLICVAPDTFWASLLALRIGVKIIDFLRHSSFATASKVYLSFVLGIILAAQLHAQPEGFYLVEGDASAPFEDSAGCLVVKVGKHAIIHWDSFSIDGNETFRFEQEDSESSVINFAEKDSAILGNLQSNGKVYLAHPSEVFIGSRATLTAPNIFLVSEQGKTEVSGHLIANSSSGKGGKIHILGNEVLITKTAVINTSGAMGEGEVLIGGSFQGEDRSIPHSKQTVVQSGAQISVEALEFGNGGRAIIWSDGNTAFDGHVNARGGKEGGDGGLVEVSGKDQLAFNGTVTTEAPKGQTGQLLLDPRFVILGGSQYNSLPSNNVRFTDEPTAIFYINIDSVMSALLASDVTIQANSDINIIASNSIVPSVGNNLFLRAGNSINVATMVNVQLGAVHLTASVNTKGAVPQYRQQGNCVFQLFEGASITAAAIVIGQPRALLFSPSEGGMVLCPDMCRCITPNNCPANTCCPNSIIAGSKVIQSIMPIKQGGPNLVGGATLQPVAKP